MKGLKKFCVAVLDTLGWILAIPAIILVIVVSVLLVLVEALVVTGLIFLAFVALILLIPTWLLEQASKALKD